jgi:hypothetical protein
MAMTYINKPIDQSILHLLPASDVTEHRLLEQDDTNTEKVKHLATAGGRAIGVSLKSGESASNQPIDVATLGVIPVTAGGAITEETYVAGDAAGKVITATAAHSYLAGYAIEGGASGDQVSIIFCPGPNVGVVAKTGSFRVLRIPITYADGTTETDTTWDLPTTCTVLPWVSVLVTTAEATGTTKTIDFGTLSTASGDADGFGDGVSVAATGHILTTLLNTGQTLGALLRADEDGAGALVPTEYCAGGGKSISWTPGSNDFAELVAELLIPIIEYAA